MFTLKKSTPLGRRGMLKTNHGKLETPFFMPVGTAGAMKGITHEELLELGAEILLCNTYHLHLTPGESIVEEAGGLHRFIGWDRPILTDSGGFQVFSLRSISDISESGVRFRSHRNGDPLFLGPEEAMRIQHHLGADIIMCFDQCPPSTANRSEIRAAVDRTLRWARDCKRWHRELSNTGIREYSNTPAQCPPLLFGIIQGGLERDLRQKCAEELTAMDFDGYAIGGLAVGETEREMFSIVEALCPLLPDDRPRYLMGVGKPEQLRRAIAHGIDMFDCVLPMREARHGTLYLSNGDRIRILSSQYAHDHTPIDPQSPALTSRHHLRSYLHHLLRIQERLGETLACMQNLGVTLEQIRNIRESIERR